MAAMDLNTLNLTGLLQVGKAGPSMTIGGIDAFSNLGAVGRMKRSQKAQHSVRQFAIRELVHTWPERSDLSASRVLFKRNRLKKDAVEGMNVLAHDLNDLSRLGQRVIAQANNAINPDHIVDIGLSFGIGWDATVLLNSTRSCIVCRNRQAPVLKLPPQPRQVARTGSQICGWMVQPGLICHPKGSARRRHDLSKASCTNGRNSLVVKARLNGNYRQQQSRVDSLCPSRFDNRRIVLPPIANRHSTSSRPCFTREAAHVIRYAIRDSGSGSTHSESRHHYSDDGSVVIQIHLLMSVRQIATSGISHALTPPSAYHEGRNI